MNVPNTLRRTPINQSQTNDPIRSLLSYLQNQLGELPNGFEPLERTVKDLFSRFELVPKQDFEAHLATLATLSAQVQELEKRLDKLEGKHTS